MKTKKIGLLASALLGACLAVATPAVADLDTIAGGKSGLAYDSTASTLSKGAARYGHKLKVARTGGGGDNLPMISEGKAGFGLAQLDTYAIFKSRNPNAPIEILGSVFTECAYIVASEKSGISSDSDLQKKGVTIAVGGKGAGSADTWDYMTALEEGFANPTTEWRGGSRAIGAVKTNQLDAFMWVTAPAKLDHKYLRAALSNDDLNLVPVTDWNLNNKLPETGEPVYEFKKVVVEKGFFNKTYETICTKSVLVANTNTSEQIRDDLANLLLRVK